jgi:hypothetical protein
VILRCTLDGLILPASLNPHKGTVTVYDGEESFELEALEAVHYQMAEATEDEILAVEGRYRLLRRAEDFCWSPRCGCPRVATRGL